jgi:septal ring factor EnvC (AmiA/AmiB activator)
MGKHTAEPADEGESIIDNLNARIKILEEGTATMKGQLSQVIAHLQKAGTLPPLKP